FRFGRLRPGASSPWLRWRFRLQRQSARRSRGAPSKVRSCARKVARNLGPEGSPGPCYHAAGIRRGQMTTSHDGMTSLRSLGLLVRQHRMTQALTQEDLAERAGLGVSAETTSNLERGNTRPYRATLDAV